MYLVLAKSEEKNCVFFVIADSHKMFLLIQRMWPQNVCGGQLTTDPSKLGMPSIHPMRSI